MAGAVVCETICVTRYLARPLPLGPPFSAPLFAPSLHSFPLALLSGMGNFQFCIFLHGFSSLCQDIEQDFLYELERSVV